MTNSPIWNIHFDHVSKTQDNVFKTKCILNKNVTYLYQDIFYHLIAIVMDTDVTGKGLSQKYIPVKENQVWDKYIWVLQILFGCNKELQMKKKKAYRKPEFRLDALTFLYFVRFFTHYLKLSKIQTNFITNNISWPAAPAQTLSLPRNNSQWNPVHLIFRVICE